MPSLRQHVPGPRGIHAMWVMAYAMKLLKRLHSVRFARSTITLIVFIIILSRKKWHKLWEVKVDDTPNGRSPRKD